jgi:hypothetical protein
VVPEFSLRSVEAGDVSLAMLLKGGRQLLLLFSDARCGSCTAFLPQVTAYSERGGL